MKNFSLLHSRVGSLAQRLAVMFCVLMLSITQAWGDPTTIYSNAGSTGTSGDVTTSGNINTNANNGKPAPCFGLTNSANKTITITGLSLSSYTDITLVLDYKLAKSGSNYSSLTVTQYNSNNQSIGSNNITGKDQTYHTSSAISVNSACTKITIVCNPASSTYNTFVDNISITGTVSTPSCDKSLSLSKVVSGNGSFSVHQGTATGTEVENSGSIDNCGDGTTTLVVVPTPTNDDYYCSAVTASGSEDVEEDSDGNWVITYNQGSTINTTVTATFSTVPSYDVTWTANGGEHAKTSVKKGNKPTFPATPVSTDAKSKQFVGWATSTWDTPLDDVSSKTIYTYGDAMPAVNGEVEYFAVWAKSTDTYAIMEYGDELTDGNYVFAAYVSPDDYAMGNTVSSNMIAGTYISVANDEIEEPNAQFIWKLSHIDDTYVSLYNAAATKDHYLGLTSSGLTLEANPSTNGQFNPVLSNTYNLATIALKSKSQSGKEIQYYQGKFKSYTSQSSDIYIYKEILEKYITTCASCNVSPSLGNPTLTSIASGKITVECPSIGAGSAACEITDYGFIWKKGSAPTMESKDGIESTGTNDQSSAYNDDLTIDVANNTGSTYYIKAYATNGNGTTLSSALEVTPQSVTFNMNGHGSQVATQYVNNGGTATDPGTTSITGYTFNGWKLNSSAYSFSSAVTSDITLVADWSVKSHTLTWTTSGDALTGDYTGKSGDVDYGTTIVAPNTPTKTGYTFAAWTPAVAATMPDNDLTYTATWTAKTTAITLNKNNEDAEGSNAGSASWTYDQTTKNSCSTATRTGYTVEGYYTAASGGTKILNADGSLAGNAITVDEVVYTNDGKWAYNGTELTLYAHWTANTYKVVFKANGGTGDDVEQTGFTYDESKTLTSLETIGFTAPEHKYFLGWNTNSSATTATYADEASVSNLSSANNGSVNLYAIWKEHTYTNYRTLCCTPLAAPASIAVSVTGAATATVTWAAVADATGYEYKLGDGDWTTASVTGTEIKTLSLSGLTGASDYTIYVRTNGDGDNCTEGTASAGTNFRTYSTVTAAVNDALMGTAKVSLNNSDWSTSVEAADGTTIYLQATPSELYEFSNWATPASGTISEGQLTGWSGDVTVTANFVAKELTKLDTPTGMGLVGEPGATSATIKWNAVDHASDYQVVCAGATIGDVTVTDGVASCELTILTAGTTYYWTVKALGDGISFEDGDACASQNFTTDLRKPTAIEITHAPTLTEYLEGQSFATAGMVVKVTYNNGDIDGAYTGYSIDPSGALTFGMTSVTVTATENGQSRSTTQAITVHKKYTLTFKNNGSIVETRDLKEGDAYGAFPDEGEACDGSSTTFMGWSTADISGKQETAPTEGYASPTDVMGTSNVVLNAVWAKLKTPEGDPTSITSFATGTYYLIDKKGDNYYAMSGTGTSKVNGVDVTDYVSYNSTTKQITITDESEMTAAMKYTISGTTSAAKIYNANNNKWVSTQGTSTSFSESEGENVVTKHETDPRFAFSYADMGTSGNRCILYRTSQNGFCNYAATNMGTSDYASGYLWIVALGTPAVYEDYITTCCDEWSVTASYGTGNVISVSDGAVAVDIEGTAYGAASYESSAEAVLIVAADGKITGVKAGSATVTIAWAGIPGSKCAYETTVDVTVNGPITVTYNANDGSQDPETTSQNATSNSAFTLDANSFSRTGYTFQGWATTPSGAKAYDNSQADVEFAEDVTLYAVWSINSHAVTLTQPTGNTITANSSTTPGNVTYGTTVNLTATENDGYVFSGWSVDGATVVDANAKSTSFTMPDNAVSVTATYSTYTWDLTGYTVETAPETEYSTGDHFSKASVVIKAGYERSDTKETKQVAVDAANWTAKLNGTEIADNYTFVIGDHGKTLTLWVGDTQVGENYVLTVNAIPTDHFVINIWTNEVSPIADKTIAYSMPSIDDQEAGEAATCKDHNLFVGWVEADYKDEPEGHIVAANTAMTPSDKTFYAVWGKTGTITESISYGWESTDDATKWSMSASKDGLQATTGSARTGTYGGSMTSTGTYVKTLSRYATPKGIKYYIRKQSGNDNTNNYYVLRYSSDNSNWTEIESTKYTFKQLSNTTWTEVTCDLRAETYQNKYFEIRMISSANGSLDDIEFSYTTSGAVDYITECVQRYQITFDANGGTGSYDAIEKKEGATVTLPDGSALSRAAEHYHFNGWKVYYTSTDEEIPVNENQFTMPGSAVNAVAQWEEDPKGTVYYVGDNIMDTHVSRYAGQTYKLRTEVTLPSSNMKLVGWMLEGDETLYAPGRTMTMPDPVQDYTYHVQIIDQLHKPSGVNFNDGEWILVTDENQLSAGDYVVIVANGLTNAMGADKGTNRDVAGVTKHNEGQTITLTENVATLFLQYGYKTGEFALYDWSAGGYLYANSNTANQMKTTDTYSDRNYSWKITIGDGNIASIVAQGDNTRNDLKYNPNSGSPLFSCYTGGQTAVQLYRYEGHKTVEITDDVNASAIYLDDADIVVRDGKTLTIDEASDLDNLTVEAGGKVSGSANLTVNNLTIESEAGKSGQVTGSNVSVNGDIYLDIKLLDGTGLMTTEESQEWYCISAPFEVNMNGGFFWGDGTPMGHNVDFQAFIYDGAKRASTGTTGWQRAGGKLEAGKAYLIGFDDEKENQKTIRLKAMSKNIPTAGQIAIEANDADEYNKNWNGVGNPTLHYIALNGAPEKVQCYDNNSFGYNPYDPATHNYVVGTALFMQAENNINLANPENTYFRAPKRESEENEQYSFCVEIAKEGATRCDNRLYVSASDEATSSYEPGKDMLAMNGTSSKFGALIWTENYGMRLASEDIPMVNQKATYSLGVFAPKDGTYSISTVEASEDATLYLTYNDRAIWNLSMSACEVELTKGLNEGYGLKLVVKAPQTPTGVEDVQMNDVQCTKMIIDEKVFILRGGKMYDVTGKAVR